MEISEASGRWALVTGASKGIGREFCEQLAAAGLHVVLVARDEAALRTAAAQIEGRYRVSTLSIPVDLGESGAADRVSCVLRDRNVRVRLLCNNAAAGFWGGFQELGSGAYERMCMLNVGAVVALTRALLPDLLSHSSSAIINVSSQAAYQPVPYMAAYGATKAFVQSFSQALHEELRDRNVLVQTLVPAPTQTTFCAAPSKLEAKRRPPAEIVALALGHLGRGSVVVSNAEGLFTQRLFAALAPTRSVLRAVGKMFRPAHEQDGVATRECGT